MFGKLRRTAEKNSEGNGMGLMVSRKLVEMNGGKIEAFSKGKGRGLVIAFSIRVNIIE